MFQFQRMWLPDGEVHFPEWMAKNGEMVDGRGTYQLRKFRAAMEHVKQFRNAVDVGAHVGFWTIAMLKVFHLVHAFEPVAAFRECFEKNVHPVDPAVRAILYPFALGKPGPTDPKKNLAAGPRDRVAMKIPVLGTGIDSGGTYVGIEEPDEFDEDAIELWALDEFGIDDVDFIKVDVEGYEDQVLLGARETIARYRPTIIVEQKPHKLGPNFGIKGTPAVDLLKSMGYRVAREMSGDYIMVPDAG